MLKRKFLSVRFEGGRFKDGEIPLDILGDMNKLKKLIFAIAKWKLQQRIPNTSDKKANKYFEQYHLSISKIEDDSAILTLNLVNHNEQREPQELNDTVAEIIYSAKDELVDTIHCANNDGSVASVLPFDLLKRIKKIGNNLRPSESMEFSSNQYSEPILFNTETRKYLDCRYNEISQTELSKIQIRGFIPEVDQNKMTFHMEIADKKRIKGSITNQNLNKILLGFNGYVERKRLLFEGKAILDKEGNIIRWDTIEKIHSPETLDVPYSLELLKELKNGWLDGEQGVAPDHNGLDWLGNTFIRYYPDSLPLPYTYPTPEGGVQMEWLFENTEFEFEFAVNLSTRRGEWFRYETSNDDKDIICKINLEKSDDWEKMIKNMEELVESIPNR